jgi:ABC-type glycerol-3-phosphate transport system permease component
LSVVSFSFSIAPECFVNTWRLRRLSSRGLLYAGALFLVLQAAFPFFWMVSTSFKPPREVFAQPPTFIPQDVTWENFYRLFTTTNFLIYFWNSTYVCGLTVLLTMAVSAAGAYSLTRYRYPGREKIAGLILCTYMFAPIMVVIPFFILVKKIGIENTHFALVLALTSFCLPFTLWLLRAFFQTIPIELEQAAMVDGAGRLRAVIYVVLPLALPGIIATSIFTFILAWNDYIFTRILITSDELKTLPVGVQDLFNSAIVDWGLIMGAGMMITIPALIFFVTVQRYLIRGWGAGAVKG